MSDIFDASEPGAGPQLSHPDPVRRAQIQMKRPLPRRFYKTVSVEPVRQAEGCAGGFAVRLDGRPVKTPGRAMLVLPTQALADLVAEEWRRQGEEINPATMPATRLANTAIDAGAAGQGGMADGPDRASAMADALRDEILRYAGNDMLCYRADGPQALVERQADRWDPILRWLDERHGIRLATTTGILHEPQTVRAIESFRRALAPYGTILHLSALNVMTTITGSAALALALAEGHLTLEETWALAHIEEDWTIEQWGGDAEAEARRAARLVEMTAAFQVLQAA